MRLAIVPLLALLAAACGREAADSGIEASGTVEATEADLGFQTGGRVAQIAVREGDRVDSGAVLARLDLTELEARHSQSRALLTAQRARLRELERGSRPEELAQAEAAARAAQRQRVEAERVAQRSRNLFQGEVLSREQLDQAETALEVATERERQATEHLELLRQGPRVEQIAAQRAQVAAAEAALSQTEAALGFGRIHAPFAGIVTRRHRQLGEIVGPGAPIVTLMDPADRWVRIYVREDRIGRVSLEQEAVIRTDSHADSTFRGRVSHIASEAEFTPRNVQTAEERLKLVYAVKVAIAGDPGLGLKPGMPADVVLREREP
jgi:HlyD family secretion protein